MGLFQPETGETIATSTIHDLPVFNCDDYNTRWIHGSSEFEILMIFSFFFVFFAFLTLKSKIENEINSQYLLCCNSLSQSFSSLGFKEVP